MKAAIFFCLAMLGCTSARGDGDVTATPKLEFLTESTVVPDNSRITNYIPAKFDYVGNLCGIFKSTTGTFQCGSYWSACCNSIKKGAECAIDDNQESTQCSTGYPYVGCCVVPYFQPDDCYVLANGKSCPNNAYAVCLVDDEDNSDVYVLADDADNQKTTCTYPGSTPYCCAP